MERGRRMWVEVGMGGRDERLWVEVERNESGRVEFKRKI